MPASEEADATDRHRVQMRAVRAVTLCGGDGHPPGPAYAECHGSPNSKGPLSRVTDTLSYTTAGTTGGELSASIAGALRPRAPCPKPACPLVSTRVQDARLHAQCRVCGHPSPRRVRQRARRFLALADEGPCSEKFPTCSLGLLDKPECVSAACRLPAGDTPPRSST